MSSTVRLTAAQQPRAQNASILRNQTSNPVILSRPLNTSYATTSYSPAANASRTAPVSRSTFTAPASQQQSSTQLAAQTAANTVANARRATRVPTQSTAQVSVPPAVTETIDVTEPNGEIVRVNTSEPEEYASANAYVPLDARASAVSPAQTTAPVVVVTQEVKQPGFFARMIARIRALPWSTVGTTLFYTALAIAGGISLWYIGKWIYDKWLTWREHSNAKSSTGNSIAPVADSSKNVVYRRGDKDGKKRNNAEAPSNLGVAVPAASGDGTPPTKPNPFETPTPPDTNRTIEPSRLLESQPSSTSTENGAAPASDIRDSKGALVERVRYAPGLYETKWDTLFPNTLNPSMDTYTSVQDLVPAIQGPALVMIYRESCYWCMQAKPRFEEVGKRNIIPFLLVQTLTVNPTFVKNAGLKEIPYFMKISNTNAVSQFVPPYYSVVAFETQANTLKNTISTTTDSNSNSAAASTDGTALSDNGASTSAPPSANDTNLAAASSPNGGSTVVVDSATPMSTAADGSIYASHDDVHDVNVPQKQARADNPGSASPDTGNLTASESAPRARARAAATS